MYLIKLPPSEVTVNFEKSGSSYKVKCSKKELKKQHSKESDFLETSKEEKLDNQINNDGLDEEPELNKEVIIHDEIKKDIKISYADYESEIEDDDIEDETVEIRENMTGLTAEQFFNKHYVNPYKPVKKRNKKIKQFEAFNNIDYQ